ncbi:MAG: Holliday junction resolvase RuvX [Dehalococcoidia bacterium]|nr:Holliday junction resolvase RuvX [Dehalococcoidia bacterium]
MRWLGLDPGEKRTGVAVSGPEATYAIPLRVLRHRAEGPALDDLRELVEQYRVDGLVIGLPLSLSGSPSQQTHAAVALARRIAAHFGVPLEMPDIARDLYPAEADTRTGEHHPPEVGVHPRVLLWDERLSSWEASRMVEPERGDRKARPGERRALDAHAAAIILQSFLDSLPREQHELSDGTTN